MAEADSIMAMNACTRHGLETEHNGDAGLLRSLGNDVSHLDACYQGLFGRYGPKPVDIMASIRVCTSPTLASQFAAYIPLPLSTATSYVEDVDQLEVATVVYIG